MRVALLVLLELVVFCSSVQITPIHVVNYSYQSSIRDIVKSNARNVNVFDDNNDKLYNLLQSIKQETIQYFTIVNKFNNENNNRELFICRYFLNQEHFLKSVYLHQLMTTTSFGVANNDINNDHPTTISKEKLSNLDADLNKVITTTANTNSDTHSINKISNTIIRFNETNSTFFIITQPKGDSLSDSIELIEVDFSDYNYLSSNYNESKLINTNSTNDNTINNKFNPNNNETDGTFSKTINYGFNFGNKNAIPLSGCLKMKNTTSFSITILKSKGKSGQILSTPLNFFIGGNFLLLLGINIDLGLNGINLSRYRSHTITCRGGTASVAAAGIDFGDKLINKPDRIEGEIIQILQPFNKNIISLPKSKYRLIKIEKNLIHQQNLATNFKKLHKHISFKKNKSTAKSFVKYEFNYVTPWKKLFTNGFKKDLGIILYLDDDGANNNIPYCESRPEYLQCNVF